MAMMDSTQKCERCDKRPPWKAPAGWYIEHGAEQCRVMDSDSQGIVPHVWEPLENGTCEVCGGSPGAPPHKAWNDAHPIEDQGVDE